MCYGIEETLSIRWTGKFSLKMTSSDWEVVSTTAVSEELARIAMDLLRSELRKPKLFPEATLLPIECSFLEVKWQRRFNEEGKNVLAPFREVWRRGEWWRRGSMGTVDIAVSCRREDIFGRESGGGEKKRLRVVWNYYSSFWLKNKLLVLVKTEKGRYLFYYWDSSKASTHTYKPRRLYLWVPPFPSSAKLFGTKNRSLYSSLVSSDFFFFLLKSFLWSHANCASLSFQLV